MKNLMKFLPVLLLGMLAPAAQAQQLPVLGVAMTEVDVYVPMGLLTVGSSYTIVTPGSAIWTTVGAANNLAGTTFTCTVGAQVGVGTAFQNPPYGANAMEAPNGIPTGGLAQLNGGNAPFGSSLVLWALATGTSPASGFTYTFFANGINIGQATPTPDYQLNYGLSWTPPQPGVYFLSVTATDGQHTATSLAVEFFCWGIDIVSPVANSILPIGSSVVLEAATSLNIGPVSRVDFFQSPGSVYLGTGRSFPYSIIYTPPAVNPHGGGNIDFIYAVSYKADGTVAYSSPAQGIQMVQAVGPLPTCSISTPTVPPPPATASTIPIPDYAANANAYVPVIVDASSPQGNIQQVELYINGVLFGTAASYPYSFKWQPAVTGTYDLTALAYDDKNNVIASTTSTTPTLTPAPTIVIVGSLPSVAITSPADGATISGGSGGSATVTASATDTNVNSSGASVGIQSVQFFLDGNLVGTAANPTTAGGSLYQVTFVPKQNIDPVTGKVDPSVLTAVATDNLGFADTSAGVTVSVTVGGNTTSTVVGTPPTVTLTAPTNNASVVVNTPVIISANAAATNVPGNVKQVEFLVDNVEVSTVTTYPYNTTFTFTNIGVYTLNAQVTDNDGNVTTSAAVTVTVTTEPPPTVNITSPLNGGISTVSNSVTISANATAASGTITSVQFYENGIAVGSPVTAPPYTASFTPLSAGVYTLTAIATDNAGEQTTSPTIVVEALPATGGLGTTEYFGQYSGITSTGANSGRFAFIVVDGTYGTYIGHSTMASPASTAFYSDVPVNSAGTFSATALNGTASVTGVSGNLTPSGDMFIGSATQSGSVSVASGYYTGNFGGVAASQVTGIVGTDGSLMLYVANGSATDVVDTTVDSTGAFSTTSVGGNQIVGKVDPNTGFLTATLAGAGGGSIIAARSSAGTFSDGVLTNISTRGQVGTGANTMITGFVVGGTAAKQLLIRSVGPTLTTFGLSGAISGTQLAVYSGSTLVASNTGWSSTNTNAASVSNADGQVGAFALPSGSADSALVGTFLPGAYTAVTSGVSGATGVALAEVYDLDAYSPFSTKKLINVSTRGTVGSGADVMIGGFNINGTAPKRLLVRGAGPGLTALGVSGALATPHLQLINANTQAVIRENYAWQEGNDSALVQAAELATGAFTYVNGSADSAILITLPPGTYTAVLSGTGSSTGTALVEVYEVP